MQDLILLILKYRNFFLFLFLEMLSLTLVVTFNRTQSDIFFSSSSFFVGTFYSQKSEFTQYVNLSEVADSLSNENARLKSLLYKYNPSESKFDTAFEKEIPHFYFHQAKVINNSIKKNKNTITIDKGYSHGLKPRMGVVSTNGLVGIIKGCSSRFSTIMSLLNRETIISAAIKKNNHFGPLSWEGDNISIFDLKDIPKHAKIAIGDSLITSGNSFIFPRNINIGKIDTFWIEPGSNYYTIKVKLFNDLSKLNYVYPIENILKPELDSLQKANNG